MKLNILCLAMLAPAAAFAQASPTVNLGPDATLLSLSVSEQVERAPDLALFNAGVTTQAATASEAMSQNATRMAGVVAALKRAGIADRDVQTAGINLQPQYSYPTRERVPVDGQTVERPPRIIGYQASNTVNVRVRKLGDMGRVIDALVGQGANQVNGPQFSLADPAEAMDEARRKAVASARARADLYARAAGLRVARIVSISEGGGYFQPMEVMVTGARVASAPPPPPTPVAIGEVSTGVGISVQFALER